MLTRGSVTHQYGDHPANCSPPPLHAYMHEHQYPAPPLPRGAGGLLGGAVTLTSRGWVGSKVGNTGYGYLGMDPSDSSTWPRPFVSTSGMISYLNYGAIA